MKKYVLVDSNNGRLGNQLFPLMVGITYLNRHINKYEIPMYFKDEGWRLCEEFRNSVDLDKLNEIVNLNVDDFQRKYLEQKDVLRRVNTPQQLLKAIEYTFPTILFYGYLQEASLIDEVICQKFLKANEFTKQKILNQFGDDIKNSICLHVRRGDFLTEYNKSRYLTITKEWIDLVIEKYYPNKRIICISDDLTWCKQTLTNENYEIVFPQGLNTSEEFWIQTLTGGNICSASTFSIAGALLNPNLNAVAPIPFFNLEEWENSIGKLIIPDWMKREPI